MHPAPTSEKKENRPAMFWGSILSATLLGVVFLLPFERIPSWEIAGNTVRLSHVAALALLGVFAVWSRLGTAICRRHSRTLGMLAAFVGASVVSAALSEHGARSAQITGIIALMALAAAAISQIQLSQTQRRRLIHVLWWSTVIIALFGVYQFIGDMLGVSPSLTGLRPTYTKAVFGFPRIQSTALEPLYFANFLLLPLGVFASIAMQGRRAHYRLSLTKVSAVLVVTGACLVLALSRGGYVGAIVTLAVVGWHGRRHLKTRRVQKGICFGAISIAVLVVLALTAFPQQEAASTNAERFQNQATTVASGPAYTERKETIQAALSMGKKSPLFGIGPGTFGAVFEQTTEKPQAGWKIVNNETAELFVEHGIVGLTLMAILVVNIFWEAIRTLRRTGNSLLLGLIAALAGMLIQYQTFSTLYILHVWVVLGLVISLSSTQRVAWLRKSKNL